MIMTVGFLIHLFSWGGLPLPTIPEPVRMLRTPRMEEEVKGVAAVEGDIFIFDYCTAVRGGPHRGHRLGP